MCCDLFVCPTFVQIFYHHGKKGKDEVVRKSCEGKRKELTYGVWCALSCQNCDV